MSKKMDIEELVKEVSVYTYVVTCNLLLFCKHGINKYWKSVVEFIHEILICFLLDLKKK